MKKSTIVLLTAISITTVASSSITGTALADTTENTVQTAVPANVSSSVTDLLNNQTQAKVSVQDSSVSKTSTRPTYGQSFSLSDFIKIPIVSKYIFKNFTVLDYAKNLRDVQFKYYFSRWTDSGMPAMQTWTSFWQTGLGGGPSPINIYVDAIYNGQTIATKVIPYDYSSYKGYSDPSPANGVATSSNDGVTPLIDSENAQSNRGVAANTDWRTDKVKYDNTFSEYLYRVSTSEWLKNATIKTNGDSGIRLSNRIAGVPDINTFSTYGQETHVISDDGTVYDFTLPKNTSWLITLMAFDQFGVPYYQVSTNGWVTGLPYQVN
ncbi:hypothetical protein [Companilactobacillus sp.]|jgi:hypothetical protein|uniref:hypothetical protein n=1 Tax=Companilactobacillus sp. TaxID=2767905 RepID=UPI0025C386BF|nr:hypothetical protein [Companilactobacillus sp.]MCH4009532.1 hypothetical protein [Companilactobacillus sp.]MCH4052792.1 hypothetical protein [Companilactobacillus sp.]MCH4077474.1 hypothetical protein [Companilactobacillus sp.]MCH4126050.1 hypothetical protein [Companilactobacillus sp.]MCI1311758.1 hypothetical protein [Companilactobacillus sp.]